MDKKLLFLFCFIQLFFSGVSQNIYYVPPVPKVLLIEKPGSQRRFSYKEEDYIKLSTKKHELLQGKMWNIGDSSVLIGNYRPLALKDIDIIYPQFRFLQQFGKYMFITGGVYFAVVSLNHLINNEQVFTKDVFVVPTTFFAAGLISISLSQKRCRIGERWKIKVLEIRLP